MAQHTVLERPDHLFASVRFAVTNASEASQTIRWNIVGKVTDPLKC